MKIILLKICLGCGDKLPATSEYFYRKYSRLCGHCKICTSKYVKKRREQNIVAEKERSRKYYKLNKDKIRKRVQKHYNEHKEEYRERSKRCYENNKPRHRAKTRNYKFLKVTTGIVTVTEWANRILEYNGRCAYCGVILEDNIVNTYNPNGIVQEHIIPVSLGGLNIIENVVPACQDCNGKKNASLNYKKPKIFTKRGSK